MVDIANLILTVILVVLYILTWVGGTRQRKKNDQVIADNNEAREFIQDKLAQLHEKMDKLWPG